MYELFEKLLKQYGVTAYRVGKETGIPASTFSDWKKGKSKPKQEKLQKIADYFGVTLDYLTTGERDPQKKETTLPPKDERDISKKLGETLNQLESRNGLMFDGEALDDETKELLKISIENAIRTAKVTAKKKYTPKKYQ